MGRREKLLAKILEGRSDAAVRFRELCSLLRWLGFVETTRGSHHLFRHPQLRERLTLQADGAHAKPYQVRQVRSVILKHGLGER